MHSYARCTWLWNFALFALTTSVSTVSAAAWTEDPFGPPAYPLAVRSPYLSCWLPNGNGTALNAAWPTFWTGSILGWAGYIRVDGTTYTFLGNPAVAAPLAAQKSTKFTSTQSLFVLTAGGVDLTAAFLSPIEPDDLVKQSLPFSYLSLIAQSNDGAPHSVQIYTDISAEWVTGDNNLTANWTTMTGDILTHQIQLKDPTPYSEMNDHIQDGAAYYSTDMNPRVTYQIGVDNTVRRQFVVNGVLLNTQDTNYRRVDDQWPVFAFAMDMGNITASTQPWVMSIGHVREPAVQYIVAGDGRQDRSLYFWSAFATVADAISFFLSDYSAALQRATTFDSKVAADAAEISRNYAAVVALSIRQAFAATEITISKAADGSWNTTDIMVFLKEISSSGNVNTVDVIFPTWPLFLYTNPAIGKYLLLPHFRYQASGQYPNRWSIHDMGAHYPKALGHNDGQDEAMPLEECGNMLIMTLSHYQRTGDDSIISSYSGLLDQWTQYLIEEALVPAAQISTDDFAGPLSNQTNLAIKGIVGIRAMAEIACIMGDQAKSSNYTSIAQNYVSHWQTLATSSDRRHLTLSYGNNTSWGLAYNLYAEKLLGFSLFPQSIYDMQTSWYQGVIQAWGVPLDTRHTYTKTDWSIWTAAIATSTQVRDQFVASIYNFASNGKNKMPFSDWYDTLTGISSGFRARPVVGGHLALMKGVLPPTSMTLAKSRRDGTCGLLIQSSGVNTAAATSESSSFGRGRRNVSTAAWMMALAAVIERLL